MNGKCLANDGFRKHGTTCDYLRNNVLHRNKLQAKEMAETMEDKRLNPINGLFEIPNAKSRLAVCCIRT